MKRDFSTVLRNLRGAVIPVPNSIAYSKLDEEGMRDFHRAAIAFLREPHAQRVLWPHLSIERRAEMMEGILSTFDR